MKKFYFYILLNIFCVAVLLKTVFCCIFWWQKILILCRKIVANLLIFVYFPLSKKRRSWFHKNLHNSGMFGCRKLPDPVLNRIFNALPFRVQCTLSFQWTNFDLKCLFLVLTKLSFWQGDWTLRSALSSCGVETVSWYFQIS